jgi:uncharacterized protein (TIGR02246 family)
MKIRCLPVFLLACFSAAALEASQPQKPGAPPQVAGIADQWAKLWSAKQLEPIVGLYASDAVFLTGTGDRITGVAALREAFQKGMSSATAQLTTHSVATESSGDLAYDCGDYRETITFANGKKSENRGSYIIIFRRQPDGRWLIAQHAWTEAPPASR